MMKVLIRQYFTTHLSLSSSDAAYLHEEYYKSYGLAIEGLVRHHKIDSLDYNRKVDDALPLENVLHPNPALRALLLDIDTTKVKLWLFTNAYVTHGRRVERLLGLEGIFEGISFCDYAQETLVCKPKPAAFEMAERDAGVTKEMRGRALFIDDSAINCKAAVEWGWGRVVQKLEEEDPEPEVMAGTHVVRDMQELRGLFPEIFKSTATAAKAEAEAAEEGV
ncbi:Haloacid dehalogenase-like hydrolase-domain-containing protein [Geopyxis carbonaria]|nr:Haloacid dehalogenase-like hydrolase-domain-containing protein [Geopyxis carbonaria]